MSYGSFINIIYKHLSGFDRPRILEIGVECGNITLPMLTNLINKDIEFSYYGIDIDIRDNISNFQNRHNSEKFSIVLTQGNSLEEMPKLVDSKFDIILIDGDHNYYTLNLELNYAKSMMHDNTIIIADDYHGPWALVDYWYGEHAQSPQLNNSLATHPSDVKTRRWWRAGLLAAVNDFIYDNDDLELYSLAEAESKLYKHNDNIKLDKHRGYCHAVMIKKEGFNNGLLAEI